MSLKSTLAKTKYNYGLIAFISALLLGCVLFLPSLIYNNGYFIYYGDFNAQQIPFYKMVHDSILKGDTMWSNTTDLGANLVGSYSFYLLGSPFFWVTMLFPSSVLPNLMAPLLILKFGCAGWCAYIYLKRYVKNKQLAVFGGLLYAFSGFSIYNIFFNHFHEAIIIFPLLLFAIDEYMYNRRKGIVALTVFCACVFNYYFFVGQVVFVIMYWLIRFCTKTYPKFKFKDFLILAFEVIIGFLMSSVLLIPSILSVIQNNRLNTLPNGWNAILYDVPQRYAHIIQSFFFPPDIPAKPNFTPDSESKWASIASWLPLVGMTGVIGFLQSRGKHWIKKLLPMLFVVAMVPIFNALFQGLNMNYYARWFYMLDLVMALATVIAIENSKTDWLRATRLSGGITAVMLILIGFMPYDDYSQNEAEPVTKFGLESFSERFWIYGGIALTSICIFTFIIKSFANNRKRMIRVLCCALAGVVAVYGNFIIYLGTIQGDDNSDFIIDYAINGNTDELGLTDIKNVRSDYYECNDNLGMYWQTPTIQAFHSIVPGSIMDFYPTFDSARDVASRPDENLYGLRGLLSVKYLFDNPDDDSSFIDKDGKTKIPGFYYTDTKCGVNIYENKYFVSMGFMYEDFICKEEYDKISTDLKDQALLKAMVLSQSQMKKYADITGYTEGDFDKINNSDDHTEFTGISSDFRYGESAYFADCKRLSASSCKDFSYINNGFTATIDNQGEDNLLFFSVPYEEGWKAYVNGEEVEIEKVNISFMAVKVKGHEKSEIRFEYSTPGLTVGLIITIVCGFIFVLYIVLLFIMRRKREFRR